MADNVIDNKTGPTPGNQDGDTVVAKKVALDQAINTLLEFCNAQERESLSKYFQEEKLRIEAELSAQKLVVETEQKRLALDLADLRQELASLTAQKQSMERLAPSGELEIETQILQKSETEIAIRKAKTEFESIRCEGELLSKEREAILEKRKQIEANLVEGAERVNALTTNQFQIAAEIKIYESQKRALAEEYTSIKPLVEEQRRVLEELTLLLNERRKELATISDDIKAAIAEQATQKTELVRLVEQARLAVESETRDLLLKQEDRLAENLRRHGERIAEVRQTATMEADNIVRIAKLHAEDIVRQAKLDAEKAKREFEKSNMLRQVEFDAAQARATANIQNLHASAQIEIAKLHNDKKRELFDKADETQRRATELLLHAQTLSDDVRSSAQSDASNLLRQVTNEVETQRKAIDEEVAMRRRVLDDELRSLRQDASVEIERLRKTTHEELEQIRKTTETELYERKQKAERDLETIDDRVRAILNEARATAADIESKGAREAAQHREESRLRAQAAEQEAKARVEALENEAQAKARALEEEALANARTLEEEALANARTLEEEALANARALENETKLKGKKAEEETRLKILAMEQEASQKVSEIQDEAIQVRNAKMRELELEIARQRTAVESELKEMREAFEHQLENEKTEAFLQVEKWREEKEAKFIDTRNRVAAQLVSQLQQSVDAFVEEALAEPGHEKRLRRLGTEVRNLAAKIFVAEHQKPEGSGTARVFIPTQGSPGWTWLQSNLKYYAPTAAVLVILLMVGTMVRSRAMSARNLKEVPASVTPGDPEKVSLFSPPTTPEGKFSYTDDVISTTNYIKIYFSADFQKRWVLALSEFVDRRLDRDAQVVVKIVPKEKQLIRRLQGMREAIRPESAGEEIARMREVEAETTKEIGELLGSSDNFTKFRQFHREFFEFNRKENAATPAQHPVGDGQK